MAEASQAVTHRRIVTIALPIIISNAATPLLGAVDTAVVGQMGAAAPIGAVGIGAIILTSIYWLFGFLRMGTVGLASQAMGAGDTAEVHALLSRALLIGVVAGVALVGVQGPLFYGAFLVSPAGPEVEELARSYMSIRIWSAPALIAMYGVTGWLVAQERTGAVLVIQLFMNGANMVLDIWFVLGLELGVNGVAWATFIAEWAGLLLGLWFCRTVFALNYWRDRVRVFEAQRLRRMALINRDIMLRSVLIQAIFVSFLFLGSGLDDVTLASNQVLLQFVYITAYSLDGFAYAVQTLVGQAIGRRDMAALRRSTVLSVIWGGGVGGLVALVFAAFGGALIDLITTAPDVRDIARAYLVYVVLCPLLGAWSWMLDGVFIGATRARDMRNMMAVSVAVYGASVYVLLPLWGNHGLWIALMISFVVRAVTLAIRYPALEAEARKENAVLT